MSPIHRGHHESKDSIRIQEKLLRDESISDAERGFLLYLLTNRNDWNICPKDISERRGIPIRTVQRILCRLEKAGYITKIWMPRKLDNGKYTSATYYTVYEDKDMTKLYESKVPF